MKFCFPLLLFICFSFSVFAQDQGMASPPVQAVPEFNPDDYKPFLDPISAQTVFPGQKLTISLSAYNEAGSTIILEFNWAKGGRMDQEKKQFSWTPRESDLGSHPIIFTAIDSTTKQQVSQPAIITVKPISYPPRLSISSTKDLTASLIEVEEGEDFALVIEGLDRNPKDALSLDYYLNRKPGQKLPNGRFQVNERVATFLWTPTNEQAQEKNFTLSFRVRDQEGKADEKHLYILVKDILHQPVFKNPTRSYVFGEGKVSSFTVQATDNDDDPISYGIQTADIREGDYFFDQATGKFQWTPNFDYANRKQDYKLVFSASDGLHTIFDTITVRVSANNYPPQIGKVRSKTIRENEELLIVLDVQDKNGEENLRVTLADDGGINGYYFDEKNRTLRWRPNYNFVQRKGQEKTIELKFRASDGLQQAEQTVQVTVIDRDDPEETLQTYTLAMTSATQTLRDMTALDAHLTHVIKRKRTWNIFFDVATIVVGVFTGIASSKIASEKLQDASAPIGAAATSLIGIRNIANKSLDKIVNLKSKVIALNGKIQLSINEMERKYGLDPTEVVTERSDFKTDLTELVKKVETFEEEKVDIEALYANLPIKKKSRE